MIHLKDIINYYTKEAGVRNLEREIANICRKAAKSVVENNNPEKEIGKSNEDLQEFRGFESKSRKEEQNLNILFLHRIREKLGHASGANFQIKILKTRGLILGKDQKIKSIDDEKEKEEIIKDKLELIQSCKQLFRDFLETVIDGRQPVPKSPLFTIERMKEAYEKSDFDWTDQKEITKFGRWLFDDKDEPTIGELSF